MSGSTACEPGGSAASLQTQPASVTPGNVFVAETTRLQNSPQHSACVTTIQQNHRHQNFALESTASQALSLHYLILPLP